MRSHATLVDGDDERVSPDFVGLDELPRRSTGAARPARRRGVDGLRPRAIAHGPGVRGPPRHRRRTLSRAASPTWWWRSTSWRPTASGTEAAGGLLRTWLDGDSVICGISDDGRIDDPMVGRERRSMDSVSGQRPVDRQSALRVGPGQVVRDRQRGPGPHAPLLSDGDHWPCRAAGGAGSCRSATWGSRR